jgi:hypothetical protein
MPENLSHSAGYPTSDLELCRTGLLMKLRGSLVLNGMLKFFSQTRYNFGESQPLSSQKSLPFLLLQDLHLRLIPINSHRLKLVITLESLSSSVLSI